MSYKSLFLFFQKNIIMDFLLTIIIFCIVFFIYLHITYQYKRSEDLEIYELDYNNNSHLQEICDVKQPILFLFGKNDNTEVGADLQTINDELFTRIQNHMLSMDQSDDIKLKDSNDYFKSDSPADYIVLPFQSVNTLLKTDSNSHYFIENNPEFIEESKYYKEFRELDNYLKPSFTVNTKYDICMGSKGTVTPLRYHTDYRRFYLVTHGKIHIKMTPFKSSKYLYPYKNFDNYEFCSPVNVWDTQPKYLNEMDKIKCLEFDVYSGYVLYIPPYWWYSIKYSNENDTILAGVTYNSAMNVVANSYDYFQYFLQQQNIYNKITRTLQSKEDEPVVDGDNTYIVDTHEGNPTEMVDTTNTI